MKLALIPPRGWERHALHTDFHLALAQVSNKFYDEVYTRAADRDDFIIVDNGASEGRPVGDFLLYSQAKKWNASEVVLPDVMFNGIETFGRAQRFERNIHDSAYVFDAFNYMAVAQGQSVEEVKDCITNLSGLSYVTTIGIPRHLIRTLQNRFIRLALAEWIDKEFPNRFQIHLLGTHPSVPSEIVRAARDTPCIRSVDTSMPFNYAIAGVTLTQTAPAIGRPANYLHDIQNMSSAVLKQNIETMKRWTAGRE